MKNLSVKLRITLWYVLVMTLISAALLTVMSTASRNILEKDIAGRTIRIVDNFTHRIYRPGDEKFNIPRFAFYEQGVHMELYDEFGSLIGGGVPFNIPEKKEKFVDKSIKNVTDDEGNKYLVYVKKLRTNDGIFWARGITSVTESEFAIKSAMKTNILLTIIMILIAAAGGYFIISRALVPVKKITLTAKEISESRNLSQRINLGEGGDEIHALADTFDEMLEKVELAMEKEKQFTSDASHELRTPVAVILSECEYMTDCAKNFEEIKESAESVKIQARKMTKLISELLTISRIDKNTVKTDFERIDVSELLEFVCDEQEEIQDKEITLIRNINSDIKADGDKDLLARLFINLISNAYTYGKEKGKVTVSLENKGENVVFKVRDDGIGIKKEDLPKIWERFYQVDPSRSFEENGNSGLGLSMVKWIAECHNGSMSVESVVGEGSEFMFIFPMVRNS